MGRTEHHPPLRAIIIAAGRGSRLDAFTHDRPKCLVTVGTRTILDHQLAALRACGIEDIAMVVGYRAECLELPGITRYTNPAYASTNVLHSLMCAREAMNGPFLSAYSDIIYRPGVVQVLLGSPADIAIVVDTAWRAAYVGRDLHPVDEAEKVTYDADGHLLAIGKGLPADRAHGEFIGLMTCTARGAATLVALYERARAVHGTGPFGGAASLDHAYLSDFLAYAVRQGVPVDCVRITGGWMEIDTPQDLDRARNLWTPETVCP